MALVNFAETERIEELTERLAESLSGEGTRAFLENTLMPLREVIHERATRGQLDSFRALRFAELATRVVRGALPGPSTAAKAQLLLATPPVDANPLGLAVMEALLATESIPTMTLGPGAPAPEVARAAEAYGVRAVVLFFERGIAGKAVGREVRSLRQVLPAHIPLVISGRAVELLANPIDNVRVIAGHGDLLAQLAGMGMGSASARDAA
jgi:hypothetical protein